MHGPQRMIFNLAPSPGESLNLSNALGRFFLYYGAASMAVDRNKSKNEYKDMFFI